MTFKVNDRVRETTQTVGAGTYTLDGAVAGYESFATGIGANLYTTYYVTNDVDWEVGIGQVLAGPNRITRDKVLSSSNADAAVNWGVGVKKIRCGLPSVFAFHRRTSKPVGGGAGTTVLTQDEQRCGELRLSGALTGARAVEVDDTPWFWGVVHNATTGAFPLTLRVTGQPGVQIPQGVRQAVYCNGTDVLLVDKINDLTEDTTPDEASDFVRTWDASATEHRKVRLSKLRLLPRGYIDGLVLANNAGDATNDIDIAAGQCRSDADDFNIVLAGALTKQLDAAWAVGTNAGGRASGAAIANGTYHVFVIRRTDTGVVDIAFDTSATGANIAANTAAAYTQKRRIGAILREAGAIVAFMQDGDVFQRKALASDVAVTNPGNAAVTRTMSVPTGIRVQGLFVGGMRHNASSGTVAQGLLSDLSVNDEVPSNQLCNWGFGNNSGTFQGNSGNQALIWTNTSAQIRSRVSGSDAGLTLSISTRGWIDPRGKDA